MLSTHHVHVILFGTGYKTFMLNNQHLPNLFRQEPLKDFPIKFNAKFQTLRRDHFDLINIIRNVSIADVHLMLCRRRFMKHNTNLKTLTGFLTNFTGVIVEWFPIEAFQTILGGYIRRSRGKVVLMQFSTMFLFDTTRPRAFIKIFSMRKTV